MPFALDRGAAAGLHLHAVRDDLYAVIFGSLPWLSWQGRWTLALAAVLVAEIVFAMWVYNGRTIGYPHGSSRWRRDMPATSSPEKEQKDSRLSIRASEPEKALLAQAARARHMNTSQFVLQASLEAAHAVLVDQTAFRLPQAQWEAFCQRLDEPARDIPELRQLFSEPEPFGEAGG